MIELKITDKELIEMKTDINHIKLALEKMPTIEGMKLANKELITEVFRDADKKYASKMTERIVWGTSVIIGSTFLYAVIDLVIK